MYKGGGGKPKPRGDSLPPPPSPERNPGGATKSFRERIVYMGHAALGSSRNE